MTDNRIPVASSPVKTTIDIPEVLCKAAKIRAIERGQTLRDLVIASLERELAEPAAASPPARSFIARRKLLPAYESAWKAGAFLAGTDSTVIISEDRTSRESALL